MSRTLWLRKVQGGRIGFVPTDRADEIELERLPFGRDLRAEITVAQSVPYHRMMMKAFTLIANVLNGGPGDKDWDRDKVRRRLLIHTGYADIEVLRPATLEQYGLGSKLPAVNLEPRSMAFDSMEFDERVRFFEAALLYVLGEFGAWVTKHPDWVQVQNIGSKLHLPTQKDAAA